MADFNNEQRCTPDNQLVQRRRLFGQLYDLYTSLKAQVDELRGIVPPLPDPNPPSGGGQVDSVVAGTDISVDNTDPANPIVSFSGSTGGQVDSVVAGDGIDVDATDPVNPEVSLFLSTDGGNTAVFGTDQGLYVPAGGGGGTVPIVFGVGPNPLGVTIGLKRYLYLPANYELTAWHLAGDVAGDAVIDIWASPTFPPVIGDSITASAPPELSSQIVNSGVPTGWTTTLPTGTWLAFSVISASTVQRLDLTLSATKS